MRDDRIRRALLRIHGPDDVAAERRTWNVVRTAYERRHPVPPPRRYGRQLALAACVLAVAAAVVTSPGRALIDSLRDAVGRDRVRGVPHAAPEIFRLPAPGRVLVSTPRGAWVLRSNGSKRLLGRYTDAAWSQYGLFVVAVRGRELVALTPRGQIRWTVARRARPQLPSWSPAGRVRHDTRIAYLSGGALHVIGGDSRGDRVLATGVAAVRPAWRAGAAHVVAYALRRGNVVVENADTGRVLWRREVDERPAQLLWSDDGGRLAVRARRSILVYDGLGRLVDHELASAGSSIAALAFVPRSRNLVEARRQAAQTTVSTLRPRRTVFTGPGVISDLAWSADGRWLLVGWQSADQWVLIPARGRKVRAFANVSAQFRSGSAFPSVGSGAWLP